MSSERIEPLNSIGFMGFKWATPEDEKAAATDWMAYGALYVHRLADGTARRVDPTTVMLSVDD